jgi:CheY-like chemotaxis protein
MPPEASTTAEPQHAEMARAFKGLGVAVLGPFGPSAAVPSTSSISSPTFPSPAFEGAASDASSRPSLEATHCTERSTVLLNSGLSPFATTTGISAAAASTGPAETGVARHAFPHGAVLATVPSPGSLERDTPVSGHRTPASDGEERVLPAPSGMPPRILLAEDNAVNSMIAKRFLRNLGHRDVTHVENGQAAVEAMQRDPFHLVLMDCQMPVMDGYEATRRIRALPDPAKRGIPIVALTASALKADVDRCMAAGMDDHLSKPYDSKGLGAKLLRWLRPSVPFRHSSSAPVLSDEKGMMVRTPSTDEPDGRASAASSGALLGAAER